MPSEFCRQVGKCSSSGQQGGERQHSYNQPCTWHCIWVCSSLGWTTLWPWQSSRSFWSYGKLWVLRKLLDMHGRILVILKQQVRCWKRSVSKVLGLSFGSMVLLVGSWIFCIQYVPCAGSFWCMFGVGVGFKWRTFCIGSLRGKLVLAPLGMPKPFWPSMNHYRMSFIQTPHQLQACTENIPNMENVVCEITNSQPKAPLNHRITLMYAWLLAPTVNLHYT